MAFLSGKNNNFRFHFPKVFVPEDIEKRYEPILKRIPGIMVDTVVDFINLQIKSVELQVNPQTYEPITQVDSGTPYGRVSRSDAYPDYLWRKEMTITFQLDHAYIIWCIMCDLFMHYYQIKDKYIPKPPGMEILDCNHKVLYRITFTDLLFTGVSGLDFDFSSNTIDQKTMTTTWLSNKINFELEPSRI
jgi:hypothetical protein